MAETYLPSTQEATIASLYEDVELQIIKQISDKLKAGLDAPDWQMRKALELELVKQKIQGQMNTTTTQAVKGVAALLKENYSTGADDATKVLDAYLSAGGGVVPKGPLQPSKELYTLLKEQASGLAGVQHTVLRSVDDVYRRVIAEVGAPGMLLGAETRQQAVQSALNKFADKGVTGFVDKAGRQWEMSSYVTMATGTAVHRASTQGHLDQLTASGHDLVVVSDHKGECPQCRKWEGKVLSISGIVPGQQLGSGMSEAQEMQDLIDLKISWLEKYGSKTGANKKPTEVMEADIVYLQGQLADLKKKEQKPGEDVAGTVAQARADGLEHPGCRHRYSAWFEGISKVPEPQGKPEDYDLRTRQRAMERQVRAWKRRAAAGDPKAPGKVKEWQAALKSHVDTNGLKRRSDKEQLLVGKTGTFPKKKPVVSPEKKPVVSPSDQKVIDQKNKEIAYWEKVKTNATSSSSADMAQAEIDSLQKDVNKILKGTTPVEVPKITPKVKVPSPEMKAVQAEIDKTQAKLDALANPLSPWGKKYTKDLAELKSKLDNDIPLTPKAPKVTAAPKVTSAPKVTAAPIESRGTKFWVGKAAPTKPETMGLQPPTGPGDKVFDSWIADAKAKFKAFADKTGNPKKDLTKSNNWTHFTDVMKGDTASLKTLLDGKYIDQKMYDEALVLMREATTPDPGELLAYQQKMQLAKKGEQQYLLDIADWRVANGVPAPKVHGMDAAVRHTTDPQGTAWANKTLPTPKGEGLSGLKKYTGGSYREWNAELRATAGKPTGDWAKWTTKADKGFSPTPESIVVNRGTGFNEFSVDGKRFGYDPLQLIGTVQRQDGYTSTSVGATSAFGGDVKLRVMVPKGSKTAWVDPISLNKGERELILPRGSNFLIHNAYKTPSGKWVVEAELLPEDYAGEAFGLQDLQPSVTPFT